jgi:PAS domain S-box-containing protein
MQKDNTLHQSQKITSNYPPQHQQENFSTAFLLQILNGTETPFFVKDRQHRWILLNDACCNFLGRQREELIGKSDYDFFSKAEADVFWEKDELVFTTGQTNENEESITDARGVTYLISTKKSLFTDSTGKEFLVGAIRDITKYRQVENELRSSKYLLQLVIENMPQAVYWKDCDSVYLGCSRKFAQIVGVDSPENILGKTDYDLPWKIEEAEWYQECDRRVMESQIPEYGFIETQLQADGKQRWVATNKIPLYDEDGNLIGILGNFEDITIHKQAELALQELNEELESRVEARTAQLSRVVTQLEEEISERISIETQLRSSQQLLQLVMDNIPQLIFWKDRNLTYLGCNENFARGAGLSSPENIVGLNDYDLPWTQEESDRYREWDLRVILSGIPELHIIETQRRKDGNLIWVETNKIPLRDAQGNVVGILGTSEDITERKRTEEALRQSEAKLQKLSANVPGMLYQFRLCPEGSFSLPYVNSGSYEIFGLTPEEIQVKPKLIISYIHPELRQDFENSINNSAQTLQPWCWEGQLILPTGQVKWVQAASRPEQQTDGSIIWDGLLMDITRLKQAEEELQQAYVKLETRVEERTQELARSNVALQAEIAERQQTQMQLIQSEKMSSLGQLVAGVAHEINNPVNFIYGNIAHANEYIQDLVKLVKLYQQHYSVLIPQVQQLAVEIDLDFLIEDLPKLLKSMEVGAQRIREIVVSLRTFSRMDEAEMKAVNIHEGIDSTLMILEHRIKAKPNTCAIQVIKDYGNLPLVECYAGQLNQVFMNILANAIESIEESMMQQNTTKNPQIHIRTHLINTNQVAIHIIDNGMGITDAVKQRLFDPFFTTKPIGKGTGMGLSISYQIITQRHGGSLECISQPGEGAEFVITIPLCQ